MGWDSASDWHSKADVVADSIREYAIREHSVVGNHLWGVIDTTSVGKIVVLILIDGRGGSWSRKAISEDMGPCYYDCPDKVLRAATGNPNRECLESSKTKNQSARKAYCVQFDSIVCETSLRKRFSLCAR